MAAGTLKLRNLHFHKLIFWRGLTGVFQQNELFRAIQHGKTRENHRGNLRKIQKLEK